MAGKYAVGYGKPPVHSRFQPGQSGNPRGRPKGTRNLESDLRDELKERILVREGAGERRISKQRALVKSLTAKAIKGDARAATVLLNMILRILEGGAREAPETTLTAEEKAIIEALERRLRPRPPGKDNQPPPMQRRRRVRLRLNADEAR